MAEEKDLRDILGNLNNAINRLGDAVDNNTQHVTKLTKSIGETVSTIKSSSKSVSANKLNVSELDTFLKRFRKTLETNLSAGARDSSGNLTSYAKGKITRAENDLRRELAPVLLQVQARNKNTSNSPISITDSLEGSNKVYDKITEILSKSLSQDRDTLRAIFSDLGVSTSARRQVKGKEDVGRDYKVRYDSQGNVQYVEDVGSDFAKLRDDVVALRRTLGETSKEVQTSNSHFTALSTNLQDLIDKSKTLNDIFEKINTSSSSLQNTSLPGLTTAVGDASAAMNNFVSGQNNALKSLNKSINNTIKTQQTVTNQIMQTAQKQSQQTQTGSSGNTFSRQVQKNDERSRQAGFIAMLIPALGKLLEKTVLTDSLRTAGLMIGGGMPEIGALIATLAPWIGGALMSKVGGGIVKKLTGRGAQNLTRNASKNGFFANIMGASKDMPFKQKGIWLNRWVRGFGRGLEGNTLHSSMSLDNRRALFAARYARAGEQAPVLSAEAYLQGRKARRNFSRRVGVYTKSIGKTGNRLYTGLTGVGGKGLSKIPFLTGALTIGEELLSGKFSEAHEREGRKGVLKQTGKTLAGATAAMGGAALGGKIGAAVGSIIPGAGTVAGGAIGAAIGLAVSGVMVPLFKNTTDLLTNNVDATSDLSKLSREQWGKEVTELNAIQKVMTGISSIFVGFWRWLRSLKIFGGGKDYTPSGRAENIVKKESDRIDKELNSKKYKVGTQQYNNLLNKYKREYAEQKYDPSNPVVKGAQIEAYLNSPEAEKYAQQKIANEIKSLRNKKASANSAVGAIKLPKNVVYDSENGITTVKMESMGLVGKISSGNSVPEIAAKNAENLKALDAILALGGSGFTYESAMGGKHKKSSRGRGHGDGAKVDVGGRILSPDEYDRLFRLGYFGNGTGAVGYEYKLGQTDTVTPEQYRKLYNSGQVSLAGNNHYDFTVSKGEGIAAYAKIKTETATDVEKATKVSTASLEASSEIREGLAKAIGEKKREDKTARARNIIFSAVDVTGSLGVWGITQINNTGRDAGRMRTGI